MSIIRIIMGNKKLSNIFLYIAACFFFSTALWLHNRTTKPIIHIEKQTSATNIDRNFLRFTSIGNKRLIASLIWIQTLLESDVEKYAKRDLSNWMYLRFLTISTLVPMFYENYIWGGMYLSIIKDDLAGAADIYERGLAVFPESYDLLYNAGFNYYFEMGNFSRGLELLSKIEHHPRAPQTLKFVINKLKFESGADYEVVFEFLQHQLGITRDKAFKEKLRRDIYSLKAEHDLGCLNQIPSSQSCDKLDASGVPYFEQNGVWHSHRPFKPYRIFRPERLERK